MACGSSLDHRLASLRPHHDVTGQQHPDPSPRTAPVSQRRIARAEDQVTLHLYPELFAQGGLHVNLGQHPEALLPQRFSGACRRLCVRQLLLWPGGELRRMGRWWEWPGLMKASEG
jgi:hypothetical protein